MKMCPECHAVGGPDGVTNCASCYNGFWESDLDRVSSKKDTVDERRPRVHSEHPVQITSGQLSDLGVLNEALELLDKNDTALGTHAYCASESHLSGYRLIIGFDTLGQVDAAHQAVVDAGTRRHSQTQRPGVEK